MAAARVDSELGPRLYMENNMMKKILSAVLMLALLSVVPVIAGCEENERHVKIERNTQSVSQDTVVE